MFWRRLAGVFQSVGDEMTIDRELIEDIESRLGMVGHNLQSMSIAMKVRRASQSEVDRIRLDLEAAFKSWLTLRVKLQAAGVVSNVGGS
jgi:hypothetical protein